MGAGRRVQTVQVDSSAYEPQTAPHRGLSKRELGGVIFVCNNETMEECVSKELFGLPRPHLKYVLNIEEGMPLFLFNYDDKLLHGIFVAVSAGGYNIEPHAWTSGKTQTRYPAQVRVRRDRECAAVPEKIFSRVIRENYFGVGRFMFELTKKQAQEIVQLFYKGQKQQQTEPPARVATTIAQNAVVPNGRSWKAVVKNVAASSSREIPVSGDSSQTQAFSGVSDGLQAQGFSGVSDGLHAQAFSGTSESQVETGLQSIASNVVENVLQHEDEEDAIVQRSEPVHLQPVVVETPRDDDAGLNRILENLKVVDQQPAINQWDASAEAKAEEDDLKMEMQRAIKYMESLYSKACSEVRASKHLLHLTMRELRNKEECLKGVRAKNTWLSGASHGMAKEISELNRELRELKLQVQSAAGLRGLYLIGGFNGSERMKSVEKICMKEKKIKAVAPLLAPRSCAAAAVLKEHLYVFGGVNGENWTNTVEKYDPLADEWTSCKGMSISRGMLAAVTVGDKIYAIGGRNRNTFYAEVETFDPELGWLPSVSMLQQRCSIAAAAMQGAIYVVGGSDGLNFFDSIERFDPRESIWSKLSPMSSRRVWFSSAVLNGKLYAIGGFDGSSYLESVERFDQRAGKWEIVQPLSSTRVHSAAAVMDGRICLVGGLGAEHDYYQTVECYEEASGWKTVEIAGLDKRSLLCLGVL